MAMMAMTTSSSISVNWRSHFLTTLSLSKGSSMSVKRWRIGLSSILEPSFCSGPGAMAADTPAIVPECRRRTPHTPNAAGQRVAVNGTDLRSKKCEAVFVGVHSFSCVRLWTRPRNTAKAVNSNRRPTRWRPTRKFDISTLKLAPFAASRALRPGWCNSPKGAGKARRFAQSTPPITGRTAR